MYSISSDKTTAAWSHILVDVLKLRQMEKLNLPLQEALQTDALSLLGNLKVSLNKLYTTATKVSLLEVPQSTPQDLK